MNTKDKNIVRAEIERLKEAPYFTEEHALIGYDCALFDVLSIIDSIPDHFADVSKKGEAPKGYDEAYLNECIAKASKTWKGVDVDKYMDEVRGRESDGLEEAAEEYERKRQFAPDETEPESIRNAFKAGAEWQKKRFEAEYELDWITDLKKDLYELGRKDMREQMMEGAVEGEVYKNGSESFVMSDYFSNHGIKDKQKVKLIIIPDDETLNL